MSGTYNYPNTYKGDTLSQLDITLRDAADDPIDISGAAIRCQFRRGSKTGAVVAELAVSTGITATDLAAGQFRINALPQNWSPGTYYYDVQITIGPLIRTYLEGTVNIIQDVTT